MVKNPPANAGDVGLIPGSGRSPGGGGGNPVQCPWLENPIDRGACWATVHGVTKESDMTEHARIECVYRVCVCDWWNKDPHIFPCLSSQGLWLCHLLWRKNYADRIKIRTSRREIIPDYLGGPSLITQVLKSWDCSWLQRTRKMATWEGINLPLLALQHMGEGATSQGISGLWKLQQARKWILHWRLQKER